MKRATCADRPQTRRSPSFSDLACVARQLGRVAGRPPHAISRVAARCPWGCPAAVENLPYDERGCPFPTLFWVTCPTLAVAVHRVESAGGVRRLAALLAAADQPGAASAGLLASLRAAERYERRRRRALVRAAVGGGPAARGAPAVDGGAALAAAIGGVSDASRLKCLHCHAAHALARPGYLLGRAVLAEAQRRAGSLWCDDARCREAGA